MAPKEGHGGSRYTRRRDLRRSPLRLSPTSIAVFQRCPQQYRFRYIDKLGEQYRKPRPYYTMANHVHTALTHLLSAPPGARTAALAEKLLRDSWASYRLGFKDERDEKRWLERALAQVRAFATSRYVMGSPVMLESLVEGVVSPGVLLYGRMDRVDQEAEGWLHILDYKTGTLPPQVDWTQLEFHALTLSLTSPTPVRRVSFLHLEGPTLTSRELCPEDLEQTRWQVLRIAMRIRRERGHLPHPGPWCRDCDFSPICPGRGPAADPAGLAGQRELWEEPPDDP